MKKDENNVVNISERYEIFVVLFSSSFLSSSISLFCSCEPEKDKFGIEMRNYCKDDNYKNVKSSPQTKDETANQPSLYIVASW